MSLVGTRPPTVDEWDKYELHHRARLATKPGLTGMWQVSGRSNITDLSAWLDKWNIPYDEILYGKPWPGHKGFYVDDRTVRPDEFLNCSVDELNDICNKSKCID